MNRTCQRGHSRQYYRWLLFVVALALCNICSAETLGDVLRSLHVPDPPSGVADPRQPVISYAVLNDAGDFMIAYYRESPSHELRPPLLFLRYFKTQRRWQKGEVREFPARIQMRKLDCFGSALMVYHVGHYLYVTTHLNPSAGCTLILREDLTLKQAVYGWFLGTFQDGSMLFHNSEVHFAPTHPMEISLYYPRRGTVVKIYPAARDGQRAKYIDELNEAVPDERWCRENNSHCEPERFSSEISGNVVIDEKTRSFGFIAKYDPEGYGPKVDSVGSKEVIYVYRFFANGTMAHREFTVDQAEELFGTGSVEKLLNSKMLGRIFATRSPHQQPN